ncbi:hypothetical protein CDD80_827 [Ophiocordyceps camponoti-rufipedis]|uniref:cAMP-independent regulatory protein pac2 n=1 Tax=Ophiocordyceps camponoti-rufipedis TaxID=2004952 RepID=A0A2C5YFG6_9HYPO|nr:hypothetical protein CDD80_827 [Ophiocordyceps camponoti-rufipedis]
METYHGYVRAPADAIKLFEACRQGLLPRVQRRLSEKERQSIRSGSVFVWDEREAGMRRWTDGKSWSASRVSGSFLTYREMEGKRGGGFGGGGGAVGAGGNRRGGAGKTPDSGRGSDEDHDDGEPEGYRYKADGLMKQSFSLTTTTGQHLHLISYYTRPHAGQPELPQPTNDPNLRGVVPPKGLYPESSMGESNQTPAMTRAPMQQPYMQQQQQQHQQPHHYPSYAGYGWPPSPAATPPYGQYPYAAMNPHQQQQQQQQQHHQQQQQQQQQQHPLHHGQLQHGHPPPPPPPPPQSHAQHQHHAQQLQQHAHHHHHHHHHQQHPPPPPPPPPHPHHHHSHHPHPPQHYAHYTHAPPPERNPLPPPVQTNKPPYPGPQHHAHHHPRLHDSPRQKKLQEAAQAVMCDPQLAAKSLPALNSVMATPPTRHLSVTPPRSSAATTTRPSLSALLHPTPASSEPGSAKTCSSGSAGSSPRTAGVVLDKAGASEDVRALRMLDRKFCI